MLDSLAEPLASALAFFYDLVPNYAVAIALLTVVVMLVLFPLTAKSTRSMAAMQRLQPEIKRLQAQHKNDRQKLNEEMMALYKEHKVNPLGGCLPILLQMPVFLVMYQVINGLTRRGPDDTFDPRFLSPESALFRALDGAQEMTAFGVDLARGATDSHDSVAAALPFFALILAMVGAQYLQQRQLNARNPQASANPQMQMIQRVMPAFFGFISLSFPAGLVIYWLVQNLFRIGQQYVMYRLDPGSKAAAPVGPGNPVAARAVSSDEKDEKAAADREPGTPAKRSRGDAAPPARPARAAKAAADAPAKGSPRPARPRPASGRVTPPPGQPGNGNGARPATRRTRKGR